MSEPKEVWMHATPGFPGFDHVAGSEPERCFACIHETPELDVEVLAAAINDAQIKPSEIQLGRDLQVVAKRIAAGYRRSSRPRREPGTYRTEGGGIEVIVDTPESASWVEDQFPDEVAFLRDQATAEADLRLLAMTTARDAAVVEAENLREEIAGLQRELQRCEEGPYA